jgi:hypothetical protein
VQIGLADRLQDSARDRPKRNTGMVTQKERIAYFEDRQTGVEKERRVLMPQIRTPTA